MERSFRSSRRFRDLAVRRVRERATRFVLRQDGLKGERFEEEVGEGRSFRFSRRLFARLPVSAVRLASLLDRERAGGEIAARRVRERAVRLVH